MCRQSVSPTKIVENGFFFFCKIVTLSPQKICHTIIQSCRLTLIVLVVCLGSKNVRCSIMLIGPSLDENVLA
jgi:hypothetical protein